VYPEKRILQKKIEFMKNLFLPALLLLCTSITAQVKIGTAPTSINTSSILELENVNKALLITRVAVVRDIASPINGMIVYDVSRQCFRGYENDSWTFCLSGVPSTASVIPNNSFCTSQPISRTPCSKVSGATINDDAVTIGIEYDWPSATSTTLGVGFGVSATRALVDINEQCWARFNNNIVNTAGGSHTSSSDANGNNQINYDASAVMNGNAVDRGQGVCPVNWHVPSDCEFMFLENTIGMSAADQQTVYQGSAGRGTVGPRLNSVYQGSTFNFANGSTNPPSGDIGFNLVVDPNVGNTYSVGIWQSSVGGGSIATAMSTRFLYGGNYQYIRNRGSIERYGDFSTGAPTSAYVRCLKD